MLCSCQYRHASSSYSSARIWYQDIHLRRQTRILFGERSRTREHVTTAALLKQIGNKILLKKDEACRLTLSRTWALAELDRQRNIQKAHSKNTNTTFRNGAIFVGPREVSTNPVLQDFVFYLEVVYQIPLSFLYKKYVFLRAQPPCVMTPLFIPTAEKQLVYLLQIQLPPLFRDLSRTIVARFFASDPP